MNRATKAELNRRGITDNDYWTTFRLQLDQRERELRKAHEEWIEEGRRKAMANSETNDNFQWVGTTPPGQKIDTTVVDNTITAYQGYGGRITYYPEVRTETEKKGGKVKTSEKPSVEGEKIKIDELELEKKTEEERGKAAKEVNLLTQKEMAEKKLKELTSVEDIIRADYKLIPGVKAGKEALSFTRPIEYLQIEHLNKVAQELLQKEGREKYVRNYNKSYYFATPITDFVSSIPVPALKEYGKAKGLFDEIEVWERIEIKEIDPYMVGRKRDKYFLIAFWEEAKSLI